ncbi:MAG TPA: sugar ABC transporter permease [Candidatus Latescibacteria bacterium]|nr:sugar ABC transporter permease [Candidatus Latescibacterota bacterium]
MRSSRYLFCILVLLPIVGLYAFLRFVPIGSTFYLSFHRWNLIDRFKPFVGFGNYKSLFHSPEFLTALKNTTIFTFGTVPLTFGIALALAVMLKSRAASRYAPFYQFVYFVPVVTSMVPVAVVWKWIYDPRYGILNYLLSMFGMEPKAWLMDPDTALFAIMVMSIWKVLGYYMVILLVGLNAIPREYYEAAAIDGASGWRQFTSITLPLLKPIILFVVVISTINAYNVFTQVYVMTVGSQGAPGSVLRVLVYDMYENAFRFYKMGYASAEAVVLFLIVMALTALEFGIARER